MKRTLVKFKNSAFRRLIKRYEKFVPISFFIGGFIFDSFTLGRIDQLFDLVILCFYMIFLSVTLYLYNLVDDGKWKNTIFERYAAYYPLAIQFFLGGLASAYVIFFSRSVSLSKTASFFLILVALFFANEFLKKRISNKYFQFSMYFFMSFTFFTFMVPVIIKEMNTHIFILSGLISLVSTLILITVIYSLSPSTRAEIHIGKLSGIVFSIYALINIFYFFNLIPPVPLALDSGIVAHNIELKDHNYVVTYEKDEWYVFWREHKLRYNYTPDETVYVFTSIFAPTDLEKSIFHRWKWYNESTGKWEIMEDIGYEITGGRDAGYRGYTFKNKVKQGLWKVEVITEEELVLGVVDFEIIIGSSPDAAEVVVKKF